MNTKDLRRRFIEFFQKKGHKVFPSDSLVPKDPTLLFTSAGMNQFKNYFLGYKKDVKRAVSCQKCLRTQDIEIVGSTPFHHTFFEMLGNFSFGDYFKEGAIKYAWEFVVKELDIPTSNLWVSVYKDDKEAYDIWKEEIGLAEDRIVKLGEDTNFWPSNAPLLGPDGPCGPCSEIFFDRGKGVGCKKESCNPSCDCGRFVELWNLVFTQFNRVGINKLEPLPQKNIDTGMGLERVASVLQDKNSNFEIDIIEPIVKLCCEILKLNINHISSQEKTLVYSIVDHSRAISFAICDGVFPSNEERGYVIRKLIRKSFWTGYSLGRRKPFIYKLVPFIGELMEDTYPEVYARKEDIAQVIIKEEEKFLSTIDKGTKYLSVLIDNAKKENVNILSGQSLFKLYDTYGFPIDLVKKIASKENISIDEEGFNEFMDRQKKSSREASMFENTIFVDQKFKENIKSEFIGYDNYQSHSKILGLYNSDYQEEEILEEDQRGIIILDKTPFYPESGGQLFDTGSISTEEGEFIVEEVRKVNDTILHFGRVLKGKIVCKDAFCKIDISRRKALMRAHTATHLLHTSLRKVLGSHVVQQGSFVGLDRLRFDFSHFEKLTEEELLRVESMVNRFILQADEVIKRVLPYEEAKKEDVLALFEEKYSDLVRVVSIGDYSKELCGGTHLDNTREVGFFIIISESSISSGIRRIEALVGEESLRYIERMRVDSKKISSFLKCKEDKVWEEINNLSDKIKVLERLCNFQEEEIARLLYKDLETRKIDYKDKSIYVYQFEGKSREFLLKIVDQIKKYNQEYIAFLVSNSQKNTLFIFVISDKLFSKYKSEEFISLYKDKLGLKGGGKSNIIQGVISSIKDKDIWEKEVIDSIKEFIDRC